MGVAEDEYFDSVDALVNRSDAYVNEWTGLGLRDRDKATAARIEEVEFDDDELEIIYLFDDLIGRACEAVPQHMLRAGFSLTLGDDDQQVRQQIEAGLEEMEFEQRALEAMSFANALGGAGLLLMVDDGRPMSQPVDLENVQRFLGAHVVDKRDLEAATYYSKLDDTDVFGRLSFRKPETYTLRRKRVISRDLIMVGSLIDDGDKEVIHESRVIPFHGIRTSADRMVQNGGWGQSLIHRIYAVMRDFNNAWQSIGHVLLDAQQAKLRIEGLAKQLKLGSDTAVRQRAISIDRQRSVARMLLLDKNEEFSRDAHGMGGIDKVMEQFAIRAAAAANLPVLVLFGTSLGQALSSSGNAELDMFNAGVASSQRRTLLPVLNVFIHLMTAAKDGPTNGVVPEDWSVVFQGLELLSSKEEAERRKIVAETDAIMINQQVFDSDTVALQRYSAGGYSAETVVDPEEIEAGRELDRQSAEEPSPFEPEPEPEPLDLNGPEPNEQAAE